MSVEYNTLALDDDPTASIVNEALITPTIAPAQEHNHHELVIPPRGVTIPDPEPTKEPAVKLAIYDISKGWARWLSPIVLCRRIDVAPHTSILMYGQEYFWAGGIQKMRHEDFVEQVGHAPVEILDLGPSGIPEDLFHDFILSISPRYTAETYDLLSNNCNHFSQECAQFLVGKGIPEPILDAGLKVQQSCIGRIVLGCANLTPAVRTAAMLGTEAACALISIIVLLSMSNVDPTDGDSIECPTSPDKTVRFTITVFFMLLFWALSGLAAIGHALIFERSMACLPAPLFIEVIVSIVLAFMLYTAAVSLSVLHSSVGRLFPDRCTASDANYLKLCAVVGLIWLQAVVMLVSKVTTRVASAVQSALLTAEERANAAQAGGFGSSPVAVRETELADWS
jgi:hypothetical protein